MKLLLISFISILSWQVFADAQTDLVAILCAKNNTSTCVSYASSPNMYFGTVKACDSIETQTHTGLTCYVNAFQYISRLDRELIPLGAPCNNLQLGIEEMNTCFHNAFTKRYNQLYAPATPSSVASEAQR